MNYLQLSYEINKYYTLFLHKTLNEHNNKHLH